jgi:hypothetical protein
MSCKDYCSGPLMVKYPGSRRASGVIGDWTDLPADYVNYMARHGMSVMPPFRKIEISDGELQPDFFTGCVSDPEGLVVRPTSSMADSTCSASVLSAKVAACGS